MLQDSVLNQRYALRGDAFIIVRIGARQRHAIQRMQRGVIINAQKIGKHALIHFFGECLAFGFTALPVSFQARPSGFAESKVSTRTRSIPSSARVLASTTSRAMTPGVCTLLPSLETKYEVDCWICSVTD